MTIQVINRFFRRLQSNAGNKLKQNCIPFFEKPAEGLQVRVTSTFIFTSTTAGTCFVKTRIVFLQQYCD